MTIFLRCARTGAGIVTLVRSRCKARECGHGCAYRGSDETGRSATWLNFGCEVIRRFFFSQHYGTRFFQVDLIHSPAVLHSRSGWPTVRARKADPRSYRATQCKEIATIGGASTCVLRRILHNEEASARHRFDTMRNLERDVWFLGPLE